VSTTNTMAALLPHHEQMLAESAIAPEVAAARGYRSVTDPAELRALGFADYQARVPALLVPGRDVHGQNGRYQIRPDNPRRNDRGKDIKYEAAAGSRPWIDVPPAVQPHLGDPTVPLVITEGAKKADAAVSAGLMCISLPGVYGWRGTNEHGGKVALPDWESIALNNRPSLIIYDSDAATKPEVREAEARLARFLTSRGAKVRIVRLPPKADGSKQGLDDYLAAGHTVEQLLALAEGEPLAGEVLPIEEFLDRLPAAPAPPEADELARLRAENARLRQVEARYTRQRRRYVELLKRDRALRRLMRDPELTDGEKVQAVVLADITAKLADEQPAPVGGYHLPMRKSAPAAGCGAQTFSKRAQALARTGAFNLRAVRETKTATDRRTGAPLTDADGRLKREYETRWYIEPRATGTALLQLVVDRTHAPTPPAARKSWGGARPRCINHPDAEPIIETTTVWRCPECSDTIAQQTRITDPRVTRSKMEHPANQPARAAAAVASGGGVPSLPPISSNRAESWNTPTPAPATAPRSILEHPTDRAPEWQPGQPTLRIVGPPRTPTSGSELPRPVPVGSRCRDCGRRLVEPGHPRCQPCILAALGPSSERSARTPAPTLHGGGLFDGGDG
jgi:hypothetical protein